MSGIGLDSEVASETSADSRSVATGEYPEFALPVSDGFDDGCSSF